MVLDISERNSRVFDHIMKVIDTNTTSVITDRIDKISYLKYEETYGTEY